MITTTTVPRFHNYLYIWLINFRQRSHYEVRI